MAAVAAPFMEVEASGPLHLAAFAPARLVGSGQQAQRDSGPLLGDSDQAPASAPSVRGLPAFHLLLHRTAHFHRGLLYPTITCL